MKTLYDVLGVHPDDDAERLKEAFRSAVKASHPDLHAGNRDASGRLVEIIRANDILRDPRQRALYDVLLEFGREHRRSNIVRNITSNVIAAGVVAVTLAAGYTVFAHISKMSVANVKKVDIAAPSLLEAVADLPSQAFEATSSKELRDKFESNDASTPNAVAATTNADAVEAIRDGGPASDPPAHDVKYSVAHDAKYYREQGMVSYHSGDLPRSLVDFDLAIRLDPNSASAYVDRAIVWYRMREFKRAFADVSKARRIANIRPVGTRRKRDVAAASVSSPISKAR